MYMITARKRSLGQGNIFRSVCQEFCSQGGVPVRGGSGLGGLVPGGGGIPACLAGFQALAGGSPGPHPRGKLRGIWSRPTPKGEVEGDLVQAHTQGGS